MQKPHYFAITILLTYFSASLVLYFRLPASIPIHFNIQGVADRWTERGIVSWFLMPAISFSLYLFSSFISRIIRRYPNAVNLPQKNDFLSLHPDQQTAIFNIIENLIIYISICVTCLLVMVHFGSYSVAVGAEKNLPVFIIGAVFAFNIIVLILIFIILGNIDERIKHFKRENERKLPK